MTVRTLSTNFTLCLSSLLILWLAPTVASAGSLAVTSYSMPNGGIGSYIYQDRTYSNCFATDCTTTGALLNGGTGRLTNGVIPANDWDVNSNAAGWIGWDITENNGANPTVTFNFSGSQTVNSVTVTYDNSLGYGGVTEPGSVSIDGVNYVLSPDSTEGTQSITFSGLNLTGPSATLQFFQGAEEWIMIGQVAFNGSPASTGAAPEPGTIFLFAAGMLATGATVKLRKSR